MIRQASPEDAAALTAIDIELARDGRGMVMTEADVASVEARRARMKDRHIFLADEGGPLGYVELWRYPPTLVRHVGELALGVRPSAQGHGWGRRLMEAALTRASEIGIERLQLYMRSDNPRAKALYDSLGFEVEGTKSRFVKLADGTYVDDLTMVRFLKAQGTVLTGP